MAYEMPTKETNSHGSNSNLQLLHDGEGLDYRIMTVNKNGGKKSNFSMARCNPSSY